MSVGFNGLGVDAAMPAACRLLWTGPYAADLRGRAIDRGGPEADGLWIVATPLARDQVIGELTRRRASADRPWVLCWDDLWTEVARRHRRPPAILSDASARAALIEAIDRARTDDGLGALARVADLPGLRRELRDRFAAWTLADRAPDDPPPRGDETTAASWSVFRRYRAILKEHGAEDAAGLASWASRALDDGPLGRPESVTILDPVAPTRAQVRAIEWSTRVASSVLVTLPDFTDPDDMAIAPLWDRLTSAEFAEESFEPDRPTGLAAVERTLFDPDPTLPKLGPVDGLTILGGPKGEGLGLLLAREVARRLDDGLSPDDLLVLVPHWDDDAARALEILRAWGIPASGGGPRPLANDPAVSALRLAATIAAEGWEATALVRLLRNGAIAPSWSTPDERAEAASTIQALRAFRGRLAIETALGRAERDADDRDRARRARSLLDRLAPILDGPADPASWPERADRLRALATGLGLGPSPALGALWDALDDQALIGDRAGSSRPIDRAGFARAFESISRDLPAPRADPRPGSVRFATVDESLGARARVIFVTNLAEGTFPTRGAVASAGPDTDEEGADGIPIAYARERLAFLRALGSATDGVVLLAPTIDEKGQEVAPAGFVDDLCRRLERVGDPPSLAGRRLLDPTFRSTPDLARSAADARALAVARACLDRKPADLLALARDPAHRPALDGVAAGFRLLHGRLRTRAFDEFDGLLHHPGLVARIADEFGPGHVFSPSQIESFALCPFQFYQRYVLRLAPVADRPELRDDPAGRGDRLHKQLEEIHSAILAEYEAEAEAEADLRDRVAAFVEARRADVHDDGPADVAGGLRAIEDAGVRESLHKYARQFASYRADAGATARPRHFEWRFGHGPDDGSGPVAPPLELGEADGLVRLRGTIDRVDLIDTTDGPGFRVIDYKSGHAPGNPDVVHRLLAVQLPLYALAAERLLLDDAPAVCDFGYWSLRRDGFRAIEFGKGKTWPDLRDRVVFEVLRLVALLRRGVFTVEPRRDDCTRLCDYEAVCRIGQARDVGKEPVAIAPP